MPSGSKVEKPSSLKDQPSSKAEQAHGDEDLMVEHDHGIVVYDFGQEPVAAVWCQECETFHYIVDRPARHLRLEPFGPSEWFGGPFPEE